MNFVIILSWVLLLQYLKHMPLRPWKGHDLKYAVASCSFFKFMICDRLFYLFSIQVVNTVYIKESAVCSAENTVSFHSSRILQGMILECFSEELD